MGELLVRKRSTGPNETSQFEGYAYAPEPAKAIDARGFYCTGDVARLDSVHGKVRITIVDRIGSIFKLVRQFEDGGTCWCGN